MDSNDPFSFVLGLQTPADKEDADRILAAYVEVASEVQEMMNTKGWAKLLEEIEKFESLHKLDPAFYSEDPKLAHIHTGALYATKHIKDFVAGCDSFIKRKEYEQAGNKTEE